ncbi:hypothetical protein MMAGJ_21590 [Mycolicibacterium mageritense]|uniref:Uncharacterized protein n=1 Tax=Mycolicibacterium mageritense TaxID=53462 RepID=A0ABN5Y7N8_MYCME|nr:hypothetical protein MMAGJ_21590 [Mycolicibacterium mageritense]
MVAQRVDEIGDALRAGAEQVQREHVAKCGAAQQDFVRHGVTVPPRSDSVTPVTAVTARGGVSFCPAVCDKVAEQVPQDT